MTKIYCERTMLRPLIEEKVKLEGTFKRFSVRKESGKYHVTMLFADLVVDGVYIEHAWIKTNNRIRKVELKEGAKVKLFASVEKYKKKKYGFKIKNKQDIIVIKDGKGMNLKDYLFSLPSEIELHDTYEKYN